ncbi:MAG: phospho-sugar mutase [Oscillospiraceae bacterium]|nr:phospho-sugar mutase [Oscillospiraceae bacterium]
MDKARLNALYELWLEKATADPDLTQELVKIRGNDNEILERFYRELEFGTGGIRGVLGAGLNRMNYYTVNKATQGLANYLKRIKPEGARVAVGYDSRIKSDYFSKSAAAVLAANGIKVFMYDELKPTPMVSFAIRELGCDSGINVTASHNPSKFNGYKAYGPDGCQLSLEASDEVIKEIKKLDIFDDVKFGDFAQSLSDGMIEYISKDVEEAYFKAVKSQAIHPDIYAKSGFKVVYTPLNGAGNKPVRKVLSEMGITNIVVVPEQELPDGNFPTCPYPNPEFREALEVGLALCEKENADLLLATDPDCDRVGIAARNKDGGYELFSGNEVGVMLLEYVIKERLALGTMPDEPIAIKSIVSTTLTDAICKKYGVELIDVLTGFKFIGEQIGLLEKQGETERCIFAYEESYGYLAGSYVRDKDAVVASMLICEMAAFYHSRGLSLIEARAEMYAEYGVYYNKIDNFAFEGAAGMQKMQEIMKDLRTVYPKEVSGAKARVLSDFLKGTKLDLSNSSETPINLPKSDMVIVDYEGNATVIVRPSGTEPKIKIYYTTVGKTFDDAKKLYAEYSNVFSKMMKIDN